MFIDSDGRLRPVWAFVLSALLSCGAFVAVGYLAAALAGDHVLRFEAIFRPLLAIVLLGIFSWLLTVANHVEAHRIDAQGLPLSPGWAKQFGTGCIIGLLMVIVAVVPIAIWGSLSFRTTFSAYTIFRIAVVLFVLLSGALAEELMFRGYPFQRLVEATGAPGAIVVFSVLFGLVHLLNPGASAWGLLNTVAIGVLLSLAYLRTRTLWLPWGLHFAWNLALGLILGLPVSGLRLFNMAVHASVTGPKWLTGGSYGVEASAPCAVAILAGLLMLWRAPMQTLALPEHASPTQDDLRMNVSNSPK